MSQTASKNKFSNDNVRFHVDPTVRLDYMFAMSRDQRLLGVDVRVALYLLSRRNNKTGQLNPKHKTIAAEIGESVSTVKRSIDRLAEYGWIKVVHQSYEGGLQKSNQYNLNFDMGRSPMSYPLDHQRPTSEVIGALPGRSPVSCEEHSEENPVKEHGEENASYPNASRRECHHSLSEGTPAAQTGMGQDQSVRQTGRKTTTLDTQRSFDRLKEMWPVPSEDAEFRPGPRSEQGAWVYYQRHLRNGVTAGRIERAARKHLAGLDHLWPPSLARFLVSYLQDYLDPAQPDKFIPPDDDRPATANDNHRAPFSKVSGIYWDNDPPF